MIKLLINYKNFKILPQNNLGTVTNEHDIEIPKERDISPKEKQKTIDDVRLL